MTKYGMASSQTSSAPVSEATTQSREIRENSGHGGQESSPVLITSHKLTGHNFLQWSQSVMMFICGKGKDEYLTGEAVMPAASDPGFRKWKAENSMIMSWLINSMNNEIGENFLLFETAKGIWDAARETYSSNENTSELFQIETFLHDFRQGNQTVTHYFNTLTRHWQHLDLFEIHHWKCTEDATRYKKIVEQKRTFKFLLGLNKDLDEVRGRVMGTKPLPSLREAFSEVRREESRRKLMMGSSEPVSPALEASALAARSGNSTGYTENRQKRERPWCEHCKKVGHYKETCWKLQGKPADWKPRPRNDRDGRAYNASNSDNSTTTTNPFSREQLEMLQKLLRSTSMNTPPHEAGLVAQRDSPAALTASKGGIQPWIVDTGASDHMTGDASLFKDYSISKDHSSVRIADGSHSKVTGTGSIQLTKELLLTSVLHVPDLDCNLLSISKLTKDLNCVTKFYSNLCVFQDLDSGRTIGSADLCSGLYLFKNNQDPQASCDKSGRNFCFSKSGLRVNKDSEIQLLHYRLGHPSFMYLAKLFPRLFINKNPSSFSCEVCQFAKHTRNVYPKLEYKHSSPFTLIHSDVWGPSRIKNISGARWFVSFVDDHTRVTWVFLMKEKSEVGTIFQNFNTMIQTQFNSKIKVLKTDNAKEYFKDSLSTYLSSQGIVHISSCVDTPQQNGIAERKNRHLLEVTRCLMFSSNVPKFYWGEAILTATYLINRLPSRVLDFTSPRQVFQNHFSHTRVVSADLLPKIFGCTAFVHIYSQHRSKLDPRALKCIFIGYSPNKRGYKCYSPATKRIYTTMDVTFFEQVPFYPKATIQGENVSEYQLGESFLLEPTPSESPFQSIPMISIPQISSDSLEPSPSQIPTSTQPNESSQSVPRPLPQLAVENLRTYTRRRNREGIEHRTQSPPQEPELNPSPIEKSTGMNGSEFGGLEVPSIDDSNMPIAVRKGIRKCTNHPIGNYVSYDGLSASYRAFVSTMDSIPVPTNIHEALRHPGWKRAVQDELDALEKNGTWTLTDLPAGKRTVGCKWVFTVKYKSDGSMERLKARLVAKGFTQSYGIDYQETFAPVAKLNTIRILLSLAVNLDWCLQQLDIKNAFLNGDLEEEVYMDMPPGSLISNKVCKLQKSLYGLKQSPRAWFERFSKSVLKLGYIQCQADHTLFIRTSPSKKVAVLIVYVDDIILTGNDEEELRRLKGHLTREFEVKDLGNLKYFLGMEVARSRKGIVISQRKYVLDLLKETGMLGCKPVDTPMDPHKKLGLSKESAPVDRGRYQRLVGRLIYLSHTRPDIGFAVSVVSQFMHNPTEEHMEAVYRILRYLKMTPGKGLFFKKSDKREIEVYSDADWAGDVTDRRSTSGYCSFVWGNLVTWRSKKQSVVARSSAEAEYRSLAHGICEGIWIKRVLKELGFDFSSSVQMMCDNQAAISIAKNPVHHDRTKHVEIDRHFITEKVTSEVIKLCYVPTKSQIADILTKALPRPNFEDLSNKLGLYDIYNPA